MGAAGQTGASRRSQYNPQITQISQITDSILHSEGVKRPVGRIVAAGSYPSMTPIAPIVMQS